MTLNERIARAHGAQCSSVHGTINNPADRCILPAGHAAIFGNPTKHEAAARNGMRPWWGNPALSPFTRRALRGELPAKVTR